VEEGKAEAKQSGEESSGEELPMRKRRSRAPVVCVVTAAQSAEQAEEAAAELALVRRAMVCAAQPVPAEESVWARGPISWKQAMFRSEVVQILPPAGTVPTMAHVVQSRRLLASGLEGYVLVSGPCSTTQEALWEPHIHSVNPTRKEYVMCQCMSPMSRHQGNVMPVVEAQEVDPTVDAREVVAARAAAAANKLNLEAELARAAAAAQTAANTVRVQQLKAANKLRQEEMDRFLADCERRHALSVERALRLQESAKKAIEAYAAFKQAATPQV